MGIFDRLGARSASTSKIFRFVFVAEPADPPKAPDDPAGAYVDCWIAAATLNEAELKASTAIEESRWLIRGLEESGEIVRDDCAEDDAALECFEQACRGEEVIVFCVWPRDGDEDPPGE